jgi:hypothetical protein
METYKRGGHTVWDCTHHLVPATKYRRRTRGLAGTGGDKGSLLVKLKRAGWSKDWRLRLLRQTRWPH